VMSQLDTAFKNEYGLSLENLTGRYQSQISARIEQAEMKAQQSHQMLTDIANSRSWRITKPLRWGIKQWRRLLERNF